MNIVTNYDFPPIPDRSCDWSAIDDDTYDGAEDSHCPIGRGATETDAVIDLLGQLEEAANVRLICAGPALLEALKDMAAGWRYIRRHYGDLSGVGWDRAQNAAEAAIARAEAAP